MFFFSCDFDEFEDAVYLINRSLEITFIFSHQDFYSTSMKNLVIPMGPQIKYQMTLYSKYKKFDEIGLNKSGSL